MEELEKLQKRTGLVSDGKLRLTGNLWLISLKLFLRRTALRSVDFGKRLIDISISFFAIILICPLGIVVSFSILVTDGRPIFFSQIRIRELGKEFKLWKFRTMKKDAEEIKKDLAKQNEVKGAVTFKMKKDPRITKVGRFLRKFSIDELPQLWNVLIGDMTLVGPRPPLPSEVAKYSLDEKKRLHAKPGLTGVWQVSGRSDTSFAEQVHLDESYIRTRSLRKDLMILIKTIPAVIKGKGSY